MIKFTANFRSVRLLVTVCFLMALFSGPCFAVGDSISLAGQWRFAIDREDAGISQGWFSRDLQDRIRVPGVLQAQGYGNEISVDTPWILSLYDKSWFLREDYQAYTNAGNVKVPFICQPPRHYVGAAWYQTDVEIPAEWAGRRLVLFLERPHWETRVWMDDRLIGTNRSLCAPHEFQLGFVQEPRRNDASPSALAPGKHRLTIRVDNRLILPYRLDAHSVSDSLASSWNGIVGAVELRSTPPVWVDHIRILPDSARKRIGIQATFHNGSGALAEGKIEYLIESASGAAPLGIAGRSMNFHNAGDTNLELVLEREWELGTAARNWDAFSPALYRLRLTVRGTTGNRPFEQSTTTVFGLRDIHADGNKFIVNGTETYFRGTHNGGDFPLTGYPPTDVESWRKIIRTCQAWGLNLMRFHSWCPPEAAFVAADELGFYLQPECGMWNDLSPGTPMERMLYEETDSIIDAYGNHPSFVLLSPSNEPHARWKESLPKWVQHYREADPRRLYTTGTGWALIDRPGPVEGADYLAVARIGMAALRGQSGWFGRDYSSALRGVNVPVLAHELGQWCAYPDYDIIRKFTGYMRPGNYEIFRDSLASNGLVARNKDFAWASGRFQLQCYKEEIEANLRTPGLAGFQLLDLHDYVGQGTALVGLLDTFWEEKGYVKPAEFREFCGPTVPLARLTNRVFTADQPFDVEVEVAHFGSTPLTNVVCSWRILDQNGPTAAHGEWPARTIPIGKNFVIGSIHVDLSKLNRPSLCQLRVELEGPVTAENEWNFWVYPSTPAGPAPAGVLETASWDEAQARLASGGKVVYEPGNASLAWNCPPLDNVPIFWNRLMNPGWTRMLGLWCDAHHPALAEFPSEANCDWEWTQLTRGARAVNLGSLPLDLQPIVQAIDDWNRNWKLGAIFECKVGSGRLLVCSFDISHNLESRPAARQLRRSLLDYAASDRFQPRTTVAPETLAAVLFDDRVMRKLGAVADGEGRAAAAIDGDPNSFWTAGGAGRGMSGTQYPHALTIQFPAAVAMKGVVIMPRQNDRDHLGDVRNYVIETSDDGSQWHEAARGKLASTWSPQTVNFSGTVTAKQLRFTALSGFGKDTSAAIAELAVLYAGPKLKESPETLEFQRSRSTSTDVDEGPDATGTRTNSLPRSR